MSPELLFEWLVAAGLGLAVAGHLIASAVTVLREAVASADPPSVADAIGFEEPDLEPGEEEAESRFGRRAVGFRPPTPGGAR